MTDRSSATELYPATIPFDASVTDAEKLAYDYDDPAANLSDNRKRAAFAARAIRVYWERGFGGDVEGSGEEFSTVVGDLLGDVMHFCDAVGLDFDELVAKGQSHYLPELAGEF